MKTERPTSSLAVKNHCTQSELATAFLLVSITQFKQLHPDFVSSSKVLLEGVEFSKLNSSTFEDLSSIVCTTDCKLTWRGFASNIFSGVETAGSSVIQQSESRHGTTESSATVDSYWAVSDGEGTVVSGADVFTAAATSRAALSRQLWDGVHVTAGSLHRRRRQPLIVQRRVQRVKKRHCQFIPHRPSTTAFINTNEMCTS